MLHLITFVSGQNKLDDRKNMQSTSNNCKTYPCFTVRYNCITFATTERNKTIKYAY